MLTPFPQCTFGVEFSALLSQDQVCCHWLSVYGNSKMMLCGINCNMHSSWEITISSGLYYSLRRLRCLREFLHLHRNKKKADHCQKSTVSSNLFYALTRLRYRLGFSLHLYLDISAKWTCCFHFSNLLLRYIIIYNIYINVVKIATFQISYLIKRQDLVLVNTFSV